MESLGNFLKKEREKKGYSLEEAQEETKIQVRYLKALEEEKFEILPGEVFTKGFLRSYADFLGLSSEEIMRKYQELKGEKQEEENKALERKKNEEKAESPLKSQKLENKQPSPRPKAMAKSITLPLIIATLVVLAIGVWGYNKSVSPPVTPPKKTPVQQQTKIKPTAPLPAPVYVKTIVQQDCWLQVIIDGETAFEGQLPPKDIKEWKGQKEVTLRLGNAGGVQVKYNGKDLGMLGAQGEVIQKTFTPDDASPNP